MRNALSYFGAGIFEFGQPREFTGTIRCDAAPLLAGKEKEYLLVGYGKNGVPAEICGATSGEVVVNGTLIEREGRDLIEVVSSTPGTAPAATSAPSIPLGRYTLTGEVVDSKCYFGVMNPAEGRAHRACASLCLRGGVPAVFVARDRTGATSHLLIAGLDGKPINPSLLRWVGEAVEATGDVARQGKWLVWRIDPTSLHFAGR